MFSLPRFLVAALLAVDGLNPSEPAQGGQRAVFFAAARSFGGGSTGGSAENTRKPTLDDLAALGSEEEVHARLTFSDEKELSALESGAEHRYAALQDEAIVIRERLLAQLKDHGKQDAGDALLLEENRQASDKYTDLIGAIRSVNKKPTEPALLNRIEALIALGDEAKVRASVIDCDKAELRALEEAAFAKTDELYKQIEHNNRSVLALMKEGKPYQDENARGGELREVKDRYSELADTLAMAGAEAGLRAAKAAYAEEFEADLDVTHDQEGSAEEQKLDPLSDDETGALRFEEQGSCALRFDEEDEHAEFMRRLDEKKAAMMSAHEASMKKMKEESERIAAENRRTMEDTRKRMEKHNRRWVAGPIAKKHVGEIIAQARTNLAEKTQLSNETQQQIAQEASAATARARMLGRGSAMRRLVRLAFPHGLLVKFANGDALEFGCGEGQRTLPLNFAMLEQEVTKHLQGAGGAHVIGTQLRHLGSTMDNGSNDGEPLPPGDDGIFRDLARRGSDERKEGTPEVFFAVPVLPYSFADTGADDEPALFKTAIRPLFEAELAKHAGGPDKILPTAMHGIVATTENKVTIPHAREAHRTRVDVAVAYFLLPDGKVYYGATKAFETRSTKRPNGSMTHVDTLALHVSSRLNSAAMSEIMPEKARKRVLGALWSGVDFSDAFKDVAAAFNHPMANALARLPKKSLKPVHVEQQEIEAGVTAEVALHSAFANRATYPEIVLSVAEAAKKVEGSLRVWEGDFELKKTWMGEEEDEEEEDEDY